MSKVYSIHLGRLTDGREGVRAYMQQSRIFVGMVLILIFGEVLGLYGYAFRPVRSAACPPARSIEPDRGSLIVGLILNTSTSEV